MAKRIKSAMKQAREAVKRRGRNRAQISGMRSVTKAALTKVEAETVNVEEAETAVKTAIRKVNKAASKGAIHKKQASRRASRLMKKLNAVRSRAAGTSPPAG